MGSRSVFIRFTFGLACGLASIAGATLEPPGCPRAAGGLGSQLTNTSQALDLAPHGLRASSSAVQKHAGLYGDDDRYAVSNDTYPWRAIGKLDLGDGEQCTAVMVDACHALTAAHCMEGANKSAKTFLSANQRVSAKVASWESGRKTPFDGDADFAFLKLNSPIGKKIGWMGVADTSATDIESGWVDWLKKAKGQKLIVAGFNTDLHDGKVMTVDDQVEFVRPAGAHGEILKMRANTFGGSSGGPIWRFNEKNEPEIVGINTESFYTDGPDGPKQIHFAKDEQNRLASGVASHVFYDRLKRYLAESPCGK